MRGKIFQWVRFSTTGRHSIMFRVAFSVSRRPVEFEYVPCSARKIDTRRLHLFALFFWVIWYDCCGTQKFQNDSDGHYNRDAAQKLS